MNERDQYDCGLTLLRLPFWLDSTNIPNQIHKSKQRKSNISAERQKNRMYGCIFPPFRSSLTLCNQTKWNYSKRRYCISRGNLIPILWFDIFFLILHLNGMGMCVCTCILASEQYWNKRYVLNKTAKTSYKWQFSRINDETQVN